MSEKLGPRTFGRKEEMIFLGREISEQRNYSERIAEDIDEEVHQLVQEAADTAERILTMYRSRLDNIARAVIEKETIEGEELTKLLDGIPTAASAETEQPAVVLTPLAAT